MVENTQGVHRDSGTDAMKRVLTAKLTMYSLNLTEDHEVSCEPSYVHAVYVIINVVSCAHTHDTHPYSHARD